MEIVITKNNVPIRLSEERWIHIIENHNDLAGYYDDILETVENPDYIIKGYRNALLALKEYKKGKFLVVVYKEVNNKNGFIITSYFSSKLELETEEIVWKKK